jgi:hypothetical protein
VFEFICKDCDFRFNAKFRDIFNKGRLCINCDSAKFINSKYDYKKLCQIGEKYSIDFSAYEGKKLRDNVKISYPCQGPECKNIGEKPFFGLEKYGPYCTECSAGQVKDAKTVATNRERRGYDRVLQDPVVKETIKQHYTDTYGKGITNPSQLDSVKEQKIETCVKNKGEVNPMHVAEIVERQAVSRSYEYILPSNKVILLQGYEKYAIRDLLEIYDESQIITGPTNVPDIRYGENNGRRYYIDIFIPHIMLGIEVKSMGLRSLYKEDVIIKQNAFKAAGYACEIWVYSPKGFILNIIQ